MWLCLVGERDGVVKVTEWQKTYYTTDSGIQSGATTVRTDDDGAEYSKKYTYTTTVSETPAGKEHKHSTHTQTALFLYYTYLFCHKRITCSGGPSL